MKPTCYVCGNVIQKNPQYIGQDMYRHRRCEPGSARWMRLEAVKPEKYRSPFYELFKLNPALPEKEGQDNETSGDN